MNIYDIAEKSGVSIATVSRVLNNSPRVSANTKKKVLSVINKEGYVPNVFARGLGLDSIRLIGVMCTDITDYFYAKAVADIERLLKEKNKDIALCCTGDDLLEKKIRIADMVNRRVDAIILIGSAFKEKNYNQHICNAAKSVPVIIINGYIDLPNVYCVVCDEFGAVKENVIALSKQGCKEILYLFDVSTYSGNQKMYGYIEGCKLCNFPKENLHIEKVEHTVTDVERKINQLISNNVNFDAIVASDDILAAAALNTLQKINKKMPIIGFNNSIISECTYPALTSVDNMVETMCHTAIHLIDDLSENKKVPNKTVSSATLVERDTFKKNCNY